MILIWSSFTQIRALLRLRFEAEETHVDFGSVPKRVDKKKTKKQKNTSFHQHCWENEKQISAPHKEISLTDSRRRNSDKSCAVSWSQSNCDAPIYFIKQFICLKTQSITFYCLMLLPTLRSAVKIRGEGREISCLELHKKTHTTSEAHLTRKPQWQKQQRK